MWEYTSVMFNALRSDTDEAQRARLAALGSLGWEAYAASSHDHGVEVFLKRAVLGWPSPADAEPGWKYDPTQRFAQRYWDGLRWTEHVTDVHRNQDTDYPNRRP
jgi:hypothetical protein